MTVSDDLKSASMLNIPF